ncbi:hypothetical protein AVEN_62806-1 [Araneus ventricosus]|uniref:Uncharacterized protein n=1 Tax=Araneus ventricosus TaxID=182803 RepID=A0A4Y2P291_ARAVE|nr:hypothetical protein AVEN_62806-1 [Araneus ventricosus]
MLPVDGGQLENVKGELLKLKKKEAANCQLWHNVARTAERKKQKNKEIADCQTWHNVGRREEPKKQKNKEKRIRFGGNVTFTDSEDGDTLPHQDESSSDFSVDERPQPFSQSELNDLVRDLGLSKDGAELARFQTEKLISLGTWNFILLVQAPREGIHAVFLQRGKLVFCNDDQGLKKCFDIESFPSEWRLFIDSSKTSLKAVLLPNGNSFTSLPLGHSVPLEENYNDLSMNLEKINYQEYRWMVCGEFKMLTMLLSQQAGCTIYPCCLCLWDSRVRDLHSTKTDWSLRGAVTAGEKNVINTSLVPPETFYYHLFI